jgi:hypothetical protein
MSITHANIIKLLNMIEVVEMEFYVLNILFGCVTLDFFFFFLNDPKFVELEFWPQLL